jgi:hypothetical protein
VDLVLLELLADVGLAAEEADNALAGLVLDFGRDRCVERIREGHEQEVAHLPDRQDHVLLAELEVDLLEGVGVNLVAGDVERRQTQRATLRQQ